MARRKLTNIAISKLQPGPEVTDAESGMRVKVRETGKVVFLLRYRRPGSRKGAKLTLGFLDAHGTEKDEPVLGGPLSLAQARYLCSQARRDLAKGVDPGEVKRQQKFETRTKQQDTFESVAREYVERYSKHHHRHWINVAHGLGFNVDRATSTLAAIPRKGGLADRWRDLPLASLTRRDVRNVTDARIEAGTPFSALATFKSVRRLLNWAVDQDIITHSVLNKVKPPVRGHSRERVLTTEEIKRFWSACDQIHLPWGPYFKLLLVLGQRRNEIKNLSADEIGAEVITLPASRTKNKREHLVYLPALAQELLDSVPRLGNRWIFATYRGRPMSGISKATERLRRYMGNVEDFRLHDLRRTCATRMAELKVAPHVIDAVLNHVSGTIAGVSRTYNRYAYASEKAEALKRWSEELQRIVSATA